MKYFFTVMIFIFSYSNVFSQVKWELLSPLPTVQTFYNIHMIKGSELIATAFNGLCFRSSDLGITWKNIPINSIYALNCLHFVNPDTGFIGTNDAEMFRTVDGGNNWTKIKEGLNNGKGWNNFSFKDSKTGLAASITGLYRTIDGGYPGLALAHRIRSKMLKFTEKSGSTVIMSRWQEVRFSGRFSKPVTVEFRGTKFLTPSIGRLLLSISEVVML
jgi:photosystem II stability/assembly factor-like uncharacterized protein